MTNIQKIENMNELITVNYENDQPTVSGRELHGFLGVETPYRKWFPRMCEYGFTENVDYTPDIFVHPLNNQETTDHRLTIPMAKEICMIQRTERGKQARQYFIKLEEAWNTPELVMARALKMADKNITQLKIENGHLQQLIESNAPKVKFADTVIKTDSNISMRQMAKLLCDQNISIGEKRLFSLLRDNNILMYDNEPYQTYIDRKYFVVTENPYFTSHGDFLSRKTLVTPRGQLWITNHIEKWMEVV